MPGGGYLAVKCGVPGEGVLVSDRVEWCGKVMGSVVVPGLEGADKLIG